jgi:polyhydroxyalkanoate synthesis regulator protein
MAALSVPLASLPGHSGEEMEAVLLSYLEANTAAFPCHLGEDMEEDAKTVMLIYLVGTAGCEGLSWYYRCTVYAKL